jgi:hypothetical protein
MGKTQRSLIEATQGADGGVEIRVVDLDRGVERLVTPDEIANGIEYRDFDHFEEGRAAGRSRTMIRGYR